MVTDFRPGNERWWLAAGRTLVFVMLAAAPGQTTEHFVLCERDTGAVVTKESIDFQQYTILKGPLPGPSSAAVWIEENCPSRRCNADGFCASTSQPTEVQQPEASGSGWVVGELKSVKVGVGSASDGPETIRSSGNGPDGAVLGPEGGGDNLSPLINTATQAAGSCSFESALACADHLRNFDPEHPWLAANYAKLQRLASRQRSTEQTVWQASSALSSGKLKKARKLADTAAGIAVSCQNEAVAQLVDGIDLAIKQHRQERNAANSQIASALLPSLIDLSRVMSGGQAKFNVPRGGTSTAATVAAVTSSISADRCAYQIEFRDVNSPIPTCTCAGYHFDLQTFRCRQ